ncbi:MAG: response regulator [Candidatus Marinimicrobia bacterium]|nr:response regulator [Candidatus Neomarinimicrobiota bacterium]
MARILVVDDDPELTEVIRLYLEAEGHEVHTAHNRPDGLAALAATPPDLLILDVMMQAADDGLVMAQELRAAGNAVPILMLTAIGRVTRFQYDRDSDWAPVDAFLEKPTTPAALVETVQRLLAQHAKEAGHADH